MEFNIGELVRSKIVSTMEGKIIKLLDENHSIVEIKDKKIMFCNSYLERI